MLLLRFLLLLSCGFCLAMAPAAATSAAGTGDWLLTTSDFRTQRVSLKQIGERGIVIEETNGRARTVGFDKFLQLTRSGAGTTGATSGRFILILSGNGRLSGEPRGLEGETLKWSTPALGDIEVPLSRIRAMAQPKRVPQLSPSPASEDVITLANGDAVRGILTGIGSNAVRIQTPGRDAIDVPLDSIASVQFAAVAGAAPEQNSPDRTFLVTFGDSTTIPAVSLSLTDQTLSMNLADGSARAVPIASVAGIEQANGPVVWLSSRSPTENVHTPYLQRPFEAQMDRSVLGQPLRFADRIYARGIGVHSFSRITWNIDPGYKAFRTQYAIDGQLPHANVTVRIKLDDRVVHEQKDFRAGIISPLVLLDLHEATSITLEVEMGETYDVQDRLNWIEPALLKERPVVQPAPSTNPATSPATLPLVPQS